MSLRPLSRSAVALATALLLVLCQTAFAAQACVHSPGASDQAAAPCHGSSENDYSKLPGSPGSMSACEAGKAVGELAKVQVLALAELPVVAMTYIQPQAHATRSRAADAIHAVGYSLPLSILHCRFNN